MAASKKRPVRKKTKPRKTKPKKSYPVLSGSADCNLEKLCAYMKALSDWYQNVFIPDYKKVREALCNVEKQAFAGTGLATKPPRFCTPGSTSEPAPPVAPPVWS